MLDVRARAFLETYEAAKLPPIENLSPQDARTASSQLARMAPPGPQVGSVEELVIPGSHGSIRARLYQPLLLPPHGLILYFHGGGWVVGDVDSMDSSSVCWWNAPAVH
ncbi:MAG: hypothetical protein ABW110_19095 [Steroidobacteraceae bacterium]